MYGAKLLDQAPNTISNGGYSIVVAKVKYEFIFLVYF
jgi:hypothetical protein